jgi:hypothetical protein
MYGHFKREELFGRFMEFRKGTLENMVININLEILN